MLSKLLFALMLFAVTNTYATKPANSFTAKSWLVANNNGEILDGNNTNEVRSIASITKLMTVMVVLDSQQDLNEVINKKLFKKNITRRELISLAIIKSDNDAAKLLCDNYPTGLSGCINDMNEKAKSLQMFNTKFIEPTGLYNDNVSTAEDLIKLVIAASHYQIINEDSNKAKFVMPIDNKKSTIFNNTNYLVGQGIDVVVSKTGWIRKSGGCIVMMLDTNVGRRIVVLLGSKDTRTRIPEAKLIAFAY